MSHATTRTAERARVRHDVAHEARARHRVVERDVVGDDQQVVGGAAQRVGRPGDDRPSADACEPLGGAPEACRAASREDDPGAAHRRWSA